MSVSLPNKGSFHSFSFLVWQILLFSYYHSSLIYLTIYLSIYPIKNTERYFLGSFITSLRFLTIYSSLNYYKNTKIWHKTIAIFVMAATYMAHLKTMFWAMDSILATAIFKSCYEEGHIFFFWDFSNLMTTHITIQLIQTETNSTNLDQL